MSNENNTLPMASEAGQQLIQQAIQALQMASTGDLSQLTTQAKTSLVAAINELNTLTDVKVNGISVVDENKTAQIQSYKEVTLEEYQALPSSKLTDNIMYCITDVGRADQFPPLIYSDEEREVGVWRDGKPLYEKTVTFGAISGGEHFYIHSGVTTIDTLVNVDVMCFVSNEFIKMPMALPVSPVVVQDWLAGLETFKKDTGDLQLATGTYRPFDGGFAVFRYTKTTDTAGSGTWTTQGGFAHHYSTTEHIIGTWIDGKPLYERVLINTAMIELIADTWVKTEFDKGNMGKIIKCSLTNISYLAFNSELSAGFVDDKLAINSARSTAYSIGECAIVLQYTKTTD